MKGWLYTILAGFIIIIFQLTFPDFVPEYINKLIVNENASQFTGFVPILDAFLIIYTISGVGTLITGIVGTIISIFRNK